MNRQYIYPQNLKAQAKLWLWSLRDVAIIGFGGIISMVALTRVGLVLPLALTLVFAFLSIRPDDTTVLDFIGRGLHYFIGSQQMFFWHEPNGRKESK